MNNIQDFSIHLENKAGGQGGWNSGLFGVHGGYLLASKKQINNTFEKFKKPEWAIDGKLWEAAKGTIRIGVHEDMEVCNQNWGKTMLPH